MTQPMYAPRPAAMPRQQIDMISRAYNLAGVTAPVNHYQEVKNLILGTPTVEQVAQEYAAKAYDTTKPAAFVKEATAAVEQAQAQQALREAFVMAEGETARTVTPALTKQTALDITPAFNKDVAALVEAAGALDPANPLDPEAAIRADAGGALTTVRTILPRLATYASLYGVPTTDAAPNLNKLLAIITLPNIVAEQVKQTLGEGVVTLNPNDATGTFTVRRLNKIATEDIDRAIVAIAQGQFEGVGFELFIQGESSPRAGHMRAAFNRETIREGQRITFN